MLFVLPPFALNSTSSPVGGDNATIYYLPGTSGRSTTFAERPTAAWVLPDAVILTTVSNFALQTNAFGFQIQSLMPLPNPGPDIGPHLS